MQRIPLALYEKYDAVIFDLGGVILDIDLMAGANAFSKLCGKEAKSLLNSVVKSDFYLDYEKGKVSTEYFRRGMSKLLDVKFSDHDFDEAWGKIIIRLPNERIERLIEIRTKLHKKVFLLSNTNPLHQTLFDGMLVSMGFKNGFYDLVNHPYYSHNMGLRKPDLNIYLELIRKESLDPSKSLFVDDLLENIEAAKRVGLGTYHLSS